MYDAYQPVLSPGTKENAQNAQSGHASCFFLVKKYVFHERNALGRNFFAACTESNDSFSELSPSHGGKAKFCIDERKARGRSGSGCG